MAFTKILVEIEGTSPYSQSHRISASPRGKYEEHEEANWISKAHIVDGHLGIPSAGIATGLASAVRVRGTKVKGGGRTGMATLFRGGVMVEGDDIIPTSVKKKDIQGEWIDCGPQGKPGTTGVMRKFPIISKGWKAKFKIAILNSQIPAEDVVQAIHDLGVIIGLGRWRPEKGGKNGRFKVVKYDIVEEEVIN